MSINHKAIRATLKWLTIGLFLIALGHKLYQLYKYGGKIPKEPVNSDESEENTYDYEDDESPSQPTCDEKAEYND